MRATAKATHRLYRAPIAAASISDESNRNLLCYDEERNSRIIISKLSQPMGITNRGITLDKVEKGGWIASAVVLCTVVAFNLIPRESQPVQSINADPKFPTQQQSHVFTQQNSELLTAEPNKRDYIPPLEEIETDTSSGYSFSANTKKYLPGGNDETNIDTNTAVRDFARSSNLPIGEYNIYGDDGKYLGKLNGNRYDPDSIANPYGQYGSRYSSDSVNNPYGTYGSKYSSYSANNPYTTDAPQIYDSFGDYSGKLSSNRYDSDSISNPYSSDSSLFQP